tara:strand:- start:1039 stop:1710 length:672 start_codon:yes stop_codon:yes gene_type:complete
MSSKSLVHISDRVDESIFSVDDYKALSRGKYKTKFRGVSMQKDPISLEIYRSLLEDKNFGTIFEFGSLYGSSAAWLKHMSPDSVIYSFDINCDNINDKFRNIPGLNFNYLDANTPEMISRDILSVASKPWLIIEDCHVNVLNLTNYMYDWTSSGDYIVIEDTNPIGPDKPLIDETIEYVPFGNKKLDIAKKFGMNKHVYIDTEYCDRFGLNASNQWNSIFKIT